MLCFRLCLQDNLESATYEVFEKDATKYELYSEAVYRTLLDRQASAAAASTSFTSSTTGNGISASSAEAGTSAAGAGAGAGQLRPVLMVVGAGRGPLVRASMQASQRAGVPIKVGRSVALVYAYRVFGPLKLRALVVAVNALVISYQPFSQAYTAEACRMLHRVPPVPTGMHCHKCPHKKTQKHIVRTSTVCT